MKFICMDKPISVFNLGNGRFINFYYITGEDKIIYSVDCEDKLRTAPLKNGPYGVYAEICWAPKEYRGRRYLKLSDPPLV